MSSLNVTPIYQPKRSRICGQCCLAMAADVPLQESIKAVGHRRATSVRHLVDGAKKLGLCVPVERLMLVDDDTVFPELYIAQVKYPGRRRGWHWVLFYRGALYNPSATESKYFGGYINAYLELCGGGRPLLFYLISPNGQLPRIIQSEVDPFPMRDTLVSRGYATMDDLRWGEGLMACMDCEDRIWPQFECREELMAQQICHTCWIKRKSLRRAA